MGKPAAAAALVALLVAGCGGGPKPARRASPAAFSAEAGAVCTGATTRSGRLARLRALRPPSRDAGLYGHWLTAEKDAAAAAAALGEPAREGEEDPAVALAIAEGKIAGYARRLGVEACTRPSIGTMPP
jgi:hypothetical protein